MEATDRLDKLKFVESIKIIHPRFKYAMQLIEEAHQDSFYSGDPCSLLIYGETGSGKTTLYNTYIEKHNRVSSQVMEGIRSSTKVILHASIPFPARHSTVTERLLKELGDPYTNKGTTHQKDFRLSNLITNNKIQLVMLDEFQHFVDRDRSKVMYGVSDWFKSLINHTRVPVILFGLKSSNEVLDMNPQLSRRFPIRYELKPFAYSTGQEREEFQRLMFEIDKQLKTVFEKAANLADEQMSEQMFYATRGSIDSIMWLIRRGAKNALMRDAECIEQIDLARAFELYSHGNIGAELNPFAIHDFSLQKYGA